MRPDPKRRSIDGSGTLATPPVTEYFTQVAPVSAMSKEPPPSKFKKLFVAGMRKSDVEVSPIGDIMS